MPRLFIAVEIPVGIKEALKALSRELSQARWVPSDQLHLTLRFIGDVCPDTMAAIKERLGRLSFPPFSLTLRGTGHFPPRGTPRVLWVGIEASPALMQLQQEVELALIDCGIAPEERGFSPTLPWRGSRRSTRQNYAPSRSATKILPLFHSKWARHSFSPVSLPLRALSTPARPPSAANNCPCFPLNTCSTRAGSSPLITKLSSIKAGALCKLRRGAR